jgi:hypothetical protein
MKSKVLLSRRQYTTCPSVEDEGRAMLLVRYRRLDNGNLMYLMQMWWKHKQFIEVNEDFMNK